MRTGLLAAALVVVMLGGIAAQKGKASPTGSFALNAPSPTAGQVLAFTVTAQNIPQTGGDSTDAFVELNCTTTYGTMVRPQGTLADGLSAANSFDGTSLFNQAVFTLTSQEWATEGYVGATCTAYLFWSGYHTIRRSKQNMLAPPLTFAVSAQ